MDKNYVVGICKTMCPIKEAKLRQKENLLHRFEMKKGTESNRRPEYDPNKIVKCFGRSAAGVETTNPSDLRPFPMLVKTIKYLLVDVFPMHVNNKPLVVYNFIFDRLRAVRQDAVIQNLPPEQFIQILEPIVRFLIYFGYILAENAEEFDSHINYTHLQECLKRLLVCYEETDKNHWKNRWEMESYYLLFNLGNIKPLTRGIHFENSATNIFRNCLELSLQWYLKNYVKVFQMIQELPPLLLCIVSFTIPDIRKYAFQCLCVGFSSSNCSYPISKVKSLMLFDSENQVNDECKHFNVGVLDGKIKFLKKDFDFNVKSNKKYKLKLIDDVLLGCNVVELLISGT